MTFRALKNTLLKRDVWCSGRRKGLIVRLGAAGSTLDAQKIVWLLESNLRRLENHRNFLRGNVGGADLNA
jgi:hypothetical protein